MLFQKDNDGYNHFYKHLPDEYKLAYAQMYFAKRKKAQTFYATWIFGWHHAYLGKWGMQLLFRASCFIFIGLIRRIADVCRGKDIVADYNNTLAQQLYGLLTGDMIL